MRSWGWLIRKFSRDRSVWAPQYLSAGTWISPKASLSVLVAAILEDEAWNCLVEWNCVGATRGEEKTADSLPRGWRPTIGTEWEVAELEKHVLMALTPLPLGLASQRKAEPEAHDVRAAEESILR